MAKLNFTKTALLALAPPEAGKRLAVYDEKVPKLAMRITAAGSRTFYVVKRAGSNMAWVKLGTFPEMTVEQARGEAQKILGEFATGANPAAARRAIREEPTFAEMFEQFLADVNRNAHAKAVLGRAVPALAFLGDEHAGRVADDLAFVLDSQGKPFQAVAHCFCDL